MLSLSLSPRLISAMSGKTSEGHLWTAHTGLKQGNLTCEGVISPPQRIELSPDFVYDVVVVGAGYAGLSAARDLTIAGMTEAQQ